MCFPSLCTQGREVWDREDNITLQGHEDVQTLIN